MVRRLNSRGRFTLNVQIQGELFRKPLEAKLENNFQLNNELQKLK